MATSQAEALARWKAGKNVLSSKQNVEDKFTPVVNEDFYCRPRLHLLRNQTGTDVLLCMYTRKGVKPDIIGTEQVTFLQFTPQQIREMARQMLTLADSIEGKKDESGIVERTD